MIYTVSLDAGHEIIPEWKTTIQKFFYDQTLLVTKDTSKAK